MTPKQFAAKLRNQLEDFKKNNVPFQKAVYSTVRNVSKRAFENGKDNKGNSYQYADSWYKQYRAKKGRETAFVNWRFHSDLKSDYENAPKGSPPSAVKISPNHYQSMVRDINEIKYKYLSERFGEFLTLSDSEETKFYDILRKETTLFFLK